MTCTDVGKVPSQRTQGTSRSLAAVTAIFLLCGGPVLPHHGQTEAIGAQSSTRQAAPRTARAPSAARPAPARSAKGAAAASTPRTSSASTAAPHVVAVVNGQQITRDQLARECLRRYGEEVLENVVNRQLILQACKAQGVQITAEDINNEITRLASKLGLTPDRLLGVLEDERDITPERYRQDIVWPMLALRRLAAGKLTVTPEELKQAHESEYGPKVQVRMISTSTREKADRLRAQVVAKPDEFENVAKNHSEDINSAAALGLIPPIRKHTGSPEIEAAVFGLKAGEISPVVEAAGQFLVFKCERHIPETPILDHQAQAIRQELTERISEHKLRSAANELFQQLQDKARVVNVYNDPSLRQSMPGVAATIDGTKVTLTDLAEQCVVRHGKEVLEGEIHRAVLEQALRRRGKTIDEADIDREIDHAAQLYGHTKTDGTPDRDAWLKHVTTEEEVSMDVYVRDVVWPTVALTKLVEGDTQITEEDLQKSFTANYGERVRALAIVVGNRHTANEVWKMAKNNPDERFFGELAHEYSIEPVSRANYGQVPPIAQNSGQPLVEKEAFALGPRNPLSGVLSVSDKFIILWYLGRTEPIVKGLDDVREELVNDIRDKKQRIAMAKTFDQLKDSAQIDNYLSGSVQPGQQGPAVPAAHQVPVKQAAPATASKPGGSSPPASSARRAAPAARSATKPTPPQRNR